MIYLSQYYSTLHAAFLSGLREANRILPMLQPNKHTILQAKLWKREINKQFAQRLADNNTYPYF